MARLIPNATITAWGARGYCSWLASRVASSARSAGTARVSASRSATGSPATPPAMSSMRAWPRAANRCVAASVNRNCAARRSSGSVWRTSMPRSMSWLTNVLTELGARCKARPADAIPMPGCFSITSRSSRCAPRNDGPGTAERSLRRTRRRSAAMVAISSSPCTVCSTLVTAPTIALNESPTRVVVTHRKAALCNRFCPTWATASTTGGPCCPAAEQLYVIVPARSAVRRPGDS